VQQDACSGESRYCADLHRAHRSARHLEPEPMCSWAARTLPLREAICRKSLRPDLNRELVVFVGIYDGQAIEFVLGITHSCYYPYNCWSEWDVPMTGSFQLRDYPSDMVRLSCPKCGRAGQYKKQILIERYGAYVRLPDLKDLIAKCRHREQLLSDF